MAVREELLWFNRFPTNTKEYVGLSTAQWLPLWFHLLDRSQKILFLIALASPIGFIAYIFRGASGKLICGFIIASLVNYTGIFFWLFTAPTFRFGYAYLLACIILASAPAILKLANSLNSNPTVVFLPLAIFAILFQFYILTTTAGLSTLSQRVLLPADYDPSNVQVCPIGNTAFYCAQKLGLCNYEAFPCIPKPQTNVELRGSSLQDGFRMIRTP